MRAVAPTEEPPTAPKKKAVIVGAGWAGFGAAKHLSEQGMNNYSTIKLLARAALVISCMGMASCASMYGRFYV